jgi:hypothetical protein
MEPVVSSWRYPRTGRVGNPSFTVPGALFGNPGGRRLVSAAVAVSTALLEMQSLP